MAATVGVGVAMRVFGQPTSAAAGTGPAAPSGAVGPSDTAGFSSGPPGGSAAGPPPSSASSSSGSSAARSSSAAKYADGTYTGSPEFNGWGNVQVRVTIKGGKVASVVEIQEPDDRRSYAINQYAQPILQSEAVAAQSSNIDIVSGATYTSESYASSLQSALDQAAPSTTSAGSS